jgi:hypothetical protein
MSNFKPQVKVLSRNPAPQMIAKKDPVTGMTQLSLEDDADEEVEKKSQPTIEEIRARQQREREEKQKRYDEARAKIFGDSNPPSRSSTPGVVTPPRTGDQHHGSNRGRGRGRGGQRNIEPRSHENRRPTNQAGTRELYDPNSSAKPGPSSQRKVVGDNALTSGRSTPKEDDVRQAIRSPRGPDGSGRGGFGFARRGAKED